MRSGKEKIAADFKKSLDEYTATRAFDRFLDYNEKTELVELIRTGFPCLWESEQHREKLADIVGGKIKPRRRRPKDSGIQERNRKILCMYHYLRGQDNKHDYCRRVVAAKFHLDDETIKGIWKQRVESPLFDVCFKYGKKGEPLPELYGGD